MKAKMDIYYTIEAEKNSAIIHGWTIEDLDDPRLFKNTSNVSEMCSRNLKSTEEEAIQECLEFAEDHGIDLINKDEWRDDG